MDKLFVGFMLVIVVLAAFVLMQNEKSDTAVTYISPPTTTTIPPSATTTLIPKPSTKTPITTLIQPTTKTAVSTPTTTTSLPSFVELEIIDVGKCLQTIRGNMNTVIASVEKDDVSGVWGPDPKPRFYYSCDGGEKILFDVMFIRGGKGITSASTINNSYRLAAKCGKTQRVEDLRDCDELSISLDIKDLYPNSIDGMTVIEKEIPATTTTTLRHNTYLDKFRGLGYRRADIKISWLCPTCVPAVNRIVINEPGVKSRSLAYKQDVNYVIYDPAQVSLERILMLTNAGGDSELIDDYEF